MVNASAGRTLNQRGNRAGADAGGPRFFALESGVGSTTVVTFGLGSSLIGVVVIAYFFGD